MIDLAHFTRSKHTGEAKSTSEGAERPVAGIKGEKIECIFHRWNQIDAARKFMFIVYTFAANLVGLIIAGQPHRESPLGSFGASSDR